MADKKKPYRFKGLQRVIRYGDDPINTQQKIHEPGIEQMQSDARLESILQEGTPQQVVKAAGDLKRLQQFAQRRGQKQDLRPMQFIEAMQYHDSNKLKAQKKRAQQKKLGMRAHARLTSKHPQFVVGNKTQAKPYGGAQLQVPIDEAQISDDQQKIAYLQKQLTSGVDDNQLGQQGYKQKLQALRKLYERVKGKKVASNLDELEVQR